MQVVQHSLPVAIMRLWQVHVAVVRIVRHEVVTYLLKDQYRYLDERETSLDVLRVMRTERKRGSLRSSSNSVRF